LFATAVERLWICLGLVRQPDCGQRDAREAEAEFLQRPAPRDGLGQALGQFIELVVHNFAFVSSYRRLFLEHGRKTIARAEMISSIKTKAFILAFPVAEVAATLA